MRLLKIGIAGLGLAVLATGCTATGNIERNAAGGAAAGAIVGAIIGNNVGDGDADQGAVIGAVIGGAAGAMRGRDQDMQRAGGSSNQGYANQQAARSGPNGEPLYYDRATGRYYYVDEYGNTYWANGERRS